MIQYDTAEIDRTIGNEIYRKVRPESPPAIRTGHPTGTLQVEIKIENQNGSLETD